MPSYDRFFCNNRRTCFLYHELPTTPMNRLSTLFLLLIALSPYPTYATDSWAVHTPQKPWKATLYDACIISPTTAYAVGEYGVVRKTTDTGQTWHYLNVDISETLYSTAFSDSSSGVIVGSNGIIVRTQDGGKQWTRIEITTATLHAVRFAGTSGIIVGKHGAIFRSENNGISWDTITSPTQSTLHTLAYIGVDTALAVGDSGTVICTYDRGKTWRSMQTPATQHLRCIAIATHSVWHVAGDKGEYLRTTNAGITWESIPYDTTFSFTALFFADRNHGLASGRVYQEVTKSEDPRSLRTEDGATSWEITQLAGATRFYTAIVQYSPDFHILVGENGTLVSVSYTEDSLRQRASLYGKNLQYFALDCSDANNCTSIAESADYRSANQQGFTYLIERTTNGGQTWQTQSSPLSAFPTDHMHNITALLAIDSLNITAIGNSGMIIRTLDGGATWHQQNGNTSVPLLDVAFLNPLEGIIVGAYNIALRTTDGGTTWLPLAVPGNAENQVLSKIVYKDRDTFFIYGLTYQGDKTNRKIFFTENAGMSWTELPFYVQQGSPGSFIFLDKNTGWAIGSRPSDTNNPGIRSTDMVLHTKDGGRSWEYLFQEETGNLLSLQSADFGNDTYGMAVGDIGKITRTMDGGKNWATLPSPLETGRYISISYPRADRAILLTLDGFIAIYSTDTVISSIPVESNSSESTLRMYPNPTSSLFTIVLPTACNTAAGTLSLISISGGTTYNLSPMLKKARTSGVESMTVDLTPYALPAGMYIVKLNGGTSVYTSPLLLLP